MPMMSIFADITSLIYLKITFDQVMLSDINTKSFLMRSSAAAGEYFAASLSSAVGKKNNVRLAFYVHFYSHELSIITPV